MAAKARLSNFSGDGIFKLVPRWCKCTIVFGDCVEKIPIVEWDKLAKFNVLNTSELIL
jgi:hypothetical protein